MGFLSPDSAFMRGLSNVADAVWINILMLVTSIPLVTIGAALAAGHDAGRRAAIGEGHVTANYFKAFLQNFPKATALWVVFGGVGAGLAYSWIALQITPLLIPKFGLTILWIIGFEWVWALQARFENSVGVTLVNSFIFGVSHIGATAVLVVLDAVYIALLVASWFYMPQGLFLLLVLGYGTMVMLHTPILERVFAKYIDPAEEAGEGDAAVGAAGAGDAAAGAGVGAVSAGGGPRRN